ncbi:MAG: prenyltransferase [Bdellovibrionaceae bacterium]|nr:prenyltransferase [Bdellovibrionales bacterium]MCB9084932.1 prenyltransferase [Pseudobdellovibrionaceae bacterium]
MKPSIGNRFITLAKSDDRISAYLDGTFSEIERALPVDSLHVGSADEKVTFRIVAMTEVNAPPLWRVLWQGFRPLLLPLTLGPVATVLIFSLASGWSINWWMALSSVLAVLSWHGAAFLLNDYNDHWAGVDRLTRFGGSQIIQCGWITAARAKTWALWFFGLGLLLGLPALTHHTWSMLLIGALAMVLVLSFSYAGKGFKSLGLGNLLVFLGMGPLLTAGFSLAVSGRVQPAIFIIGSLYGIGASLCIQLRNMENLMADSQAKTGTLVSRLGFEKSKLLIGGQFLLLFSLLAVYLVTRVEAYWQALVFVPLVASLLRIYSRLKAVRSPLSSQLIGIWQEGLAFHLLMGMGLNLLLFLIWRAQLS